MRLCWLIPSLALTGCDISLDFDFDHDTDDTCDTGDTDGGDTDDDAFVHRGTCMLSWAEDSQTITQTWTDGKLVMLERLGDIQRWTWHPNGVLASRVLDVNGDGVIEKRETFDELGRPLLVSSDLQTSYTRYVYTANTAERQFVRPDGSVFVVDRTTYDEAGRVLEVLSQADEEPTFDSRETHVYDARGNETRVVFEDVDIPFVSITERTWTYDDAARTAAYAEDRVGVGGEIDERGLLQYDAQGRLIEQTTDLLDGGPLIVQRWRYEGDRLVEFEEAYGGVTTRFESWTYIGDQLVEHRLDGETESWSAEGLFLRLAGGDGGIQEWFYDQGVLQYRLDGQGPEATRIDYTAEGSCAWIDIRDLPPER